MNIRSLTLLIALAAARPIAAAPLLDLQLKTNALVHTSAAGWSLRVGPDRSTVLVSPADKQFNIGKTQYPDWVSATLWRVPVPSLHRDFLIVYVPPMASGSVAMTLCVLKHGGTSITRAADISHHYEWTADLQSPEAIRDALFVDSDSDGILELAENDVSKWGGTRTYQILVGDRFVPKWKETFVLEEPTGRIVRSSRVRIQK